MGRPPGPQLTVRDFCKAEKSMINEESHSLKEFFWERPSLLQAVFPK